LTVGAGLSLRLVAFLDGIRLALSVLGGGGLVPARHVVAPDLTSW
jgi:hypothetical protein